MPKTSPYQPIGFRLLHAFNGIFALIGMVTGYWLYDTWDQRFGSLHLPAANNQLYELHAELGEVFLGISILFLLYSLFSGSHRLAQRFFWQALRSPKVDIRRYELHRIVNSVTLLCSAAVVFSGKELTEIGNAQSGDPLRNGELGNIWYAFHLGSWFVMLMLLLLHVLMSVRVGGLPLISSLIDRRVRTSDQAVVLFRLLKRRLMRQ